MRIKYNNTKSQRLLLLVELMEYYRLIIIQLHVRLNWSESAAAAREVIETQWDCTRVSRNVYHVSRVIQQVLLSRYFVLLLCPSRQCWLCDQQINCMLFLLIEFWLNRPTDRLIWWIVLVCGVKEMKIKDKFVWWCPLYLGVIEISHFLFPPRF